MASLLSRLTRSSAKYEPLPRYFHIPGSIGSKVVVQGGRTKDFSEKSKQQLTSVVEIFDPYSELWEQRQVTGDAPSPGTYIAASTSLHDDLFSFGGLYDRDYFNLLHRLDTKTWRWCQLSPQNAEGAPMPKYGCGMISFRDSLGVFGGYGTPRGPTEPHSFIRNTRFTDGRGWTNEFHIYQLKEGVWSCPATTGERPPPCSVFTFTAIDDRRAVLVGGYNVEQGRMSDVYIIDLPTMHWIKLTKSGGGSWPEVRSSPAACCLNYGQQFPQLLVTGGLDRQAKPLSDVWILNIERGRWRKVTTSLKARYGHSLTASSLGPGLTVVTVFGGSGELFAGSSDKQPKLADTTLLQFKLVESSGQYEWELVSVVDNTQRGSEKRMVEKMRFTIEHKLQPTSESEMTRIERQELEAERDRTRAEKQTAEDRVREMEGRMREMEGERDRATEEKRVAEYRVREMEDIVRQMEGAIEGERDRVREMEGRVREVEGERDGAREELQRALARATELERRLNEVEGREHEELVVQEQAIAAEQRGPSWEVGEDDLEVMDEELGCGGWAKVKVAKLKVAAKVLHQQLIYDYHQRLFRREMDVAARVSHPNLLRFLGARLEGGMAILTEFMPTSLRALVNRRPRQLLPLKYIFSIAMDVACALNYLHHMTPDPMIHRDLSSANVLLQPTPDGGWLAKVSDYGTANFQSRLQTENPGSPVYTAPESRDPALQTPKMDIYSFGVLLIEMCTCQFPAPERRIELIDSINHPGLVTLIMRCLNEDKDRRPTAAQVIDILQSMQQRH